MKKGELSINKAYKQVRKKRRKNNTLLDNKKDPNYNLKIIISSKNEKDITYLFSLSREEIEDKLKKVLDILK